MAVAATARQIGEALAATLRHERVPPVRRLIVALSGGGDSFALLLALSADPRWSERVLAWHVHHGLQSDADRFATICQRQCEHCSVPLDTFHVSVASRGGGGPEQRAREARYRALAGALGPGDIVVFGHHRDDQAETVLQNAFRGAGARGLRGMPAVAPLGAGLLVRPMLSLDRTALAALAASAGISIAVDTHNTDAHFDRVYLRATVLPTIDRRWPDVGARLASTATRLAGDYRLTVAAARQQLQRSRSVDGALTVGPLRVVPEAAAVGLVREWLLAEGYRPPPPASLRALVAMLASARADSQTSVDGDGFRISLFQRRLYIVQARAAPSHGVLSPDRPYRVGSGDGWIALEPTNGPGLAAPAAGFDVSFRRGGERLDAGSARPRQALKEWLRNRQVLPWWRDRLPLIYAGDQIVAVGDLWQRTDSNSGTRFRVVWRDAPVVRAL
ncbi:MAG: tRNA lysidine(34) synthetase TilS [Pseudomonadota bacterium]